MKKRGVTHKIFEALNELRRQKDYYFPRIEFIKARLQIRVEVERIQGELILTHRL